MVDAHLYTLSVVSSSLSQQQPLRPRKRVRPSPPIFFPKERERERDGEELILVTETRETKSSLPLRLSSLGVVVAVSAAARRTKATEAVALEYQQLETNWC